MSSFNEVPPVVTMTCVPKCLPSSLHTCAVCKANSLVGTKIIAWMIFFVESVFSKIGIVNAAVLPVPFFALAKISLPVNAIGIDSS